MSKELLDRAYELILGQQYAEARDILLPLQEQSTTARRWLANLSEMLPGDAEPQPQEPEAVPEPAAVSTLDTASVPVVPGTEAEQEPQASLPPAAVSVPVLPPLDEPYPAAVDADDMPIDETADLLPAEDEPAAKGGLPRWEYREIVVKTWQQHVDNIEYALGEGGEKITIEDAYTRILNENGRQGWEVISEEVLPQQYVRLLMKRPVSR